VVDLGDPARARSRRLDGKSVVIEAGGSRYSTRGMLAVEQAMISAALARREEGCATARERPLTAALAARPGMSAEQARLVTQLTTSGNGVDVIAAAAGTGKTFSLDAARDAWGRSGYRVIGCALAARAAAELEAGAGIPSWTLARLLGQLDDPGDVALDPRTVVVCDEAAMVGTRTMARLLAHGAANGAKVVLVGDARQLPEIEAGGGFAALGRRLGPLTLRENRRQREAWERDALTRLRAGKVTDALDLYQAHGRVVTGATAEEAREAMVADWWAARAAGHSAVMLAARRADVDDLNARARVRMQLDGRLSGPELLVDERPYQAGDRVMCLRNQYRLDLRNGTVGTVTNVDAKARTMEICDDWGDMLWVPQRYLDAGHITHAYATTIHKGQGMTTDRAMLLGTDDLFLEMGYVGLSRGRATNHLYVVDTPDLTEEERGARVVAEQPFDELVRALGQSRAKHLAVDALTTRRPSTTELFAERDALRRVLAKAGPDPAADIRALRAERDELAGRVRTANERLGVVEAGMSRWRWLHRRPDPDWVYADRDLSTKQASLSVVDDQLRAAEARAASRSQFLEEHSAERQRLDQVERSIDAGLARRLGEIGRRPPQYLTKVLGDIPDSRRDRAAWWSAARSVETYRARAAVTADTDALGPHPKRQDLGVDWDEVHAQLLRTRSELRPIDPRERPDLTPVAMPEVGHGIDFGP
jgi:ATP-dependent exoDNAse (exonuclease V) alpha subunit